MHQCYVQYDDVRAYQAFEFSINSSRSIPQSGANVGVFRLQPERRRVPVHNFEDCDAFAVLTRCAAL